MFRWWAGERFSKRVSAPRCSRPPASPTRTSAQPSSSAITSAWVSADAEQPYRPALFALLQRQHQAPESGPGYGAGQLHVSVLIEAWREFRQGQSVPTPQAKPVGFYCDPYEAAGAAAEGWAALRLAAGTSADSPFCEHAKAPLYGGAFLRARLSGAFLPEPEARSKQAARPCAHDPGGPACAQRRYAAAFARGGPDRFHPPQASGVDDVVQGLGRRTALPADDDGLLGYHRGRSGEPGRRPRARPERALVLPVRQLASPRVRQRALRPAWQQAQQRAWWRPAPRPRGPGSRRGCACVTTGSTGAA